MLPGTFPLGLPLFPAEPDVNGEEGCNPLLSPDLAHAHGGVRSTSVPWEDAAAVTWQGNFALCSVSVHLWGQLWDPVCHRDFRH